MQKIGAALRMGSPHPLETPVTTPLRVALVTNGLNIVLDALLVTGYGPFPALGIAGVAWASVAAQWLGAIWALGAAFRAIGRPAGWSLAMALRLVRVGRDLFLRTGLLIAFLALATRAATLAGA